jgi:hypothetical protein
MSMFDSDPSYFTPPLARKQRAPSYPGLGERKDSFARAAVARQCALASRE